MIFDDTTWRSPEARRNASSAVTAYHTSALRRNTTAIGSRNPSPPEGCAVSRRIAVAAAQVNRIARARPSARLPATACPSPGKARENITARFGSTSCLRAS